MLHILLIIVGFTAGWVDSIAGGGGLLSLPTLLLIGVPTHVALGTNKLQSICGTTAATIQYGRNQCLDLRFLVKGIPLALFGSIVGTLSVLKVNPTILRGILIPVFLGIGIYLVIKGDSNALDQPEKRTPRRKSIMYLLIIVLAFYDGFFGPGTGVFFFVTMTGIMGYHSLTATGNTKLLNWSTNAAALSIFALNDQLDLKLGLLMGAANATGGWVGSSMAVKRGQAFIRIIVVIVVVALSIKLAWDY